MNINHALSERGSRVLLPTLLPPPAGNTGANEKATARDSQRIQSQVERLAKAIWKEKGCPADGPHVFLPLAVEALKRAKNGAV